MNIEQNNDYLKYRGKCKEYSEAAVAADPTLTLCRGFYWCPIWDTEEQHWWTTRLDGTIYDPTALQFPSKGLGEYTLFDGLVECAECGKKVPEANAIFESRYGFCSVKCVCKFVGCDF